MRSIILLFITLGWTADVFCQNTFMISGGTQLQSSGAYVVLHTSNLVNNGTLKMGNAGTLVFTGLKSTSFSGTGQTQIERLWLRLGNTDTLNLQSDLDIAREVNFSGGQLNLNNAAIQLGTTGILNNESKTSHAFTQGSGFIQATQILNTPADINTGNLGASISSPANLGSTTITRGHLVQTDGSTGRKSISRYYFIAPDNNTHLNATIRFTYLSSELGDISQNELSLWKNADGQPATGITNRMGTPWSDVGFDGRVDNPNYLMKSGIESFSTLTLFAANTPLEKTASVKGMFSVYPNPAVDQTALLIETGMSSSLKWRLMDGSGAVVRQKETVLQPGMNQLPVDLSGLARGVYTLNAAWGNNTRTVSIIKK